MIATFLICIVWFVTFAVFLCIGLSFNCFFKVKIPERPESVVLLFWQGLCVGLILLQLFHVFLPIDIRAVIFMGLISVTGISFFFQDLKRICKPFSSKPVFLASVGFLMIFIANQCLGVPRNCDSVTYHLLAIDWTANLPLLPGIANLVPHLGFNSAHFLYVALFEVFKHQSHSFANGLLVFSVILYGVISFNNLKRNCCRGKDLIPCLYFFLFLPVLGNKVFFANMTSPSPDCPVFLIGIILMGEVLRFLLSKDTDENIMFIVFFALYGMLVKQSFIVLGSSVVMLCFCVSNIRRGNFLILNKKWIAYFLLILAVMGLWSFRGVIKSGYPLFPASIGKFNLEWAVPDEEAER